jgi:oligosaccharide repeat unit polymerase
MSSLDIALIIFLLLVVLNYRAQRSVLYPPFIFCAMWLLDLAVLRSGLIEVDPVHGNTLAIVAAGAASFSAGGLLAGLAPRELLRIHLFPPKPEKTPYFLRNMLIIVLLCGLPALFYRILQLGQSVSGDSNIIARAGEASLEASLSGEPSQSFLLAHCVGIAICTSLLFATEKKDRQFWIVTAVTFIYACFGFSGRSGLLFLIPGLCAIHLLQTKQESLRGAIRFLRWPIAAFVALFIGLNFIFKSSESMTREIADRGVIGLAAHFVLSYIVGPLAAFDKVVQHPADFTMTTSHTFDFPLYLTDKLHLTNYTAPPQFDSFVFVPFPANVYTVFKFYFLELGTVGTMVLLLFFGLFHSLLYLKARQGGRFSTYLFAYSMYTVILVCYDDHYYAIAGLVRAIAFGLFYFLLGSVPFRLLPANMAKRRPKKEPFDAASLKASCEG